MSLALVGSEVRIFLRWSKSPLKLLSSVRLWRMNLGWVGWSFYFPIDISVK